MTLEQLQKALGLVSLRRLKCHPNCKFYKEYSYVSGRKGFFGPDTYSSKQVYQEVFEWKTQEGKTFGVAIEPVVVYKDGYPVVDYIASEKLLLNFIKESCSCEVNDK